MNKIYRVVFNRSLAVWQVVSELAGGNSKSSSAANESVVDSAKAGLSGVKKLFAKTLLQIAIASVFGVLTTASVQAQVTVDPIKNDVSANILATDGQTGNVTWNGDVTIGGARDGTVTLDGVTLNLTGGVSAPGQDPDYTNSSKINVNLGSNGLGKGQLNLYNSNILFGFDGVPVSSYETDLSVFVVLNLSSESGLVLDNTTLHFGPQSGIKISSTNNNIIIVRNHSVLDGNFDVGIDNFNAGSISQLIIADHSTVSFSNVDQAGRFRQGITTSNLSLTGGSTLLGSKFFISNGGNAVIQDSTISTDFTLNSGGNLLMQNSTYSGTFTNNGSAIFEDSILSGAFRGNNVVFENSSLSGKFTGTGSFINSSFTTNVSNQDVFSIGNGITNIANHSVIDLGSNGARITISSSQSNSSGAIVNITNNSIVKLGSGATNISGDKAYVDSVPIFSYPETLSTVNIQNSTIEGSSLLKLSTSVLSANNSQLSFGAIDIGAGNGAYNSTTLDHAEMTLVDSTMTVSGTGIHRIDSQTISAGRDVGSFLTLKNSRVTMAGQLNIASTSGKADVILKNDSILTVAGNINLGAMTGASNSCATNAVICSGNITIGDSVNAVAPGTLQAANINFGSYINSKNTLNFNHTDTTGNYVFASNVHGGNSNSSINILAGTTVFTGTSNNYIAPTNISGGILRAGAANTLSSASDHTIQAGGELDLGGYTQTLLSLNNQGILNFGGSHNNGYHPLTITGDITGGGNFIMHTNLVGGVGNTMNVLGTVYGNHSIIVVDSSASLPTGGERFTVVTQGNTTGAGNFTMAGTQMAASFGAFQYDLTIIPSSDGLSWQIAALPGVAPTTPPIALPPAPLANVLVTGSVTNAVTNTNLTDTWNNVVIGSTGVGSIVTSNSVVVGATGQLQVANGGTGTLTMTEASVLNGSGVDITVGSGVNQQGEIHITQGSSINLGASDSLVLGAAVGSRGEITLTNNGSKLRLQDNTLVLGQQGTGVLTINAGTSVDLNNVQVVLGQELTGQGILTLDNTQLKADRFTLGGHGKGTLTLTGNGSLQIDNGGAAGTGTLYFADAFTAGDPDTANGTLSINSANAQVLASTWSLSNSVTPDKGTATINFSHGNVTSGYTVMADIINGNNNSQINLRSGLTTFMGNNTYAGSTQVYNNSELKAGSATALSPNAKYQVDSGGRLDLNGFAHTLAGLNNTGLVDFGGAINNGYNPLTITGDLTGGGNFIMHTNLVTGVGNTIDVQGTVAGNHKITVVDSSASLPTGGERFTIVTQGNATGGGNFTMAGTQIAGASTRAVSFGAFQYDVTIAQAADGLSWQIAALPGVAPTTPPPVTPLVPPGGGNNGGGNTGGNNSGGNNGGTGGNNGSNNGGGNTGGNNGGSPLIPQVYDPARLSKAANMIMGTQASVMTALNGQMDIMHSRTRELSSSPMALAAQFATTPYNMYASNGDNLPSSAPNNWSANQPTVSLWTQGFRNKNTIDNGSSRSFDQRNDGLSLGGDYALVLKEGVVFIGAMVGKSKSEQTFDDPSSSELKNDFVGLYSTYAGADGLRVSGGIQLSYLKSDLTVVDNIGQQFSGDYRQLGVSTSLELGYRFDLANAYFIEPRVGVQTTSVGKEEYTLSNGLKSSDSGFDIVQGRLGVMAGKQFHLDSGGIVRTFVEGSAVNTLSGDADITINNAELLKNNMVGNYMELGAGVSYLFADKHQLSLGFQYRDGNKFTSPWGANMSYLVRF